MHLFLQGLVCDELKQIALGHSIVQVSCPCSVVSPAFFGAGISPDHVLASKWLLTVLSQIGFSVSSKEVNRYNVHCSDPKTICHSLQQLLQGAPSSFIATISNHDRRKNSIRRALSDPG